MKSRRGREKRKLRREKSRRERVRRKKMQMREKVGKLRNTVFFQWFGAPEGRKVGSLKRRVRSQLARWEMKNCTPLWREAHFQVKRYKAHHGRTTFGSWDVEKVHAVVARSTFPSQNVQNTPASDHFWKLRCRKSARRCGAKHISKSKCTKHTSLGPLLEVEMSKKCTPLWREAHFQVKMYKAHHVRTTFGSWDVEKVHAVVAQSTFPSQNVQNTPCTDHFWRFRCRKSARRCGAKHISKVKMCTKHTMYGPFLEVQMSFRVAGAKDCGPCQKWAKREGFVAFSTTTTTTLHYTTLQYITLHYNYNHTFTTFYYTTLHYTTPHSITLNYTTLHYTTFHYTTSHYTTLHYTPLHYIALQLQLHNYTPLHSTTLHYTPLHYITLHYITLHDTPLHSATLNYTTLHYITLHDTPLHCTTLHYTTLHHTTFHYTSLHYTTLNYTTTTTTTTLHYTWLH